MAASLHVRKEWMLRVSALQGMAMESRESSNDGGPSISNVLFLHVWDLLGVAILPAHGEVGGAGARKRRARVSD